MPSDSKHFLEEIKKKHKKRRHKKKKRSSSSSESSDEDLDLEKVGNFCSCKRDEKENPFI